ncbi:MAG TPA: AMP-binding protein, partial [Caulobacteraceae bacterium]|nr:AMP-binding protein [Caulobacteraceae bacterium]
MTVVAEELSPALVMDMSSKGMMSALYAELKPDAVAIQAPRGKRTFAELHANANRVAAALRRAGLKPGDHIAMMCPNTPEFIEIYAANLRSGLRLTPINWHLSPAEVAYVVSDCKAKALFAHADFPAAALASVNDQLTFKVAIGGEIEGFQDYADVLARESPADPENPIHGMQMMYTSGTTGRPKGVFRKATMVIPPNWGAESPKGYRMNEDVNM